MKVAHIRGRKLPSVKAKAAAKSLQNASRALQGKKPLRKKGSLSVKKLTSAVRSLKVAQNGRKQMRRDVCDFAEQPPAPIPQGQANTITALRPLLFLHQAISEDAAVYSLNPIAGATGSIDVYTAGVWSEQSFPLTAAAPAGLALPASYNKFDQLQFWSQSDGVQNEYFHTSTEYTMNITGSACTGYIDVFLVRPKKSYNPSAQQDLSLPIGLPALTNLTQGGGVQYAVNPLYFSCKRIKRHYFNTTAPAGAVPEERELQTNPNYDIKFKVVNAKSRRHIKAPELNSGAAILDSTDIPFRKQDWILVSSSIADRDNTTDNNIRVNHIFRTCHWRDYYGAST